MQEGKKDWNKSFPKLSIIYKIHFVSFFFETFMLTRPNNHSHSHHIHTYKQYKLII